MAQKLSILIPAYNEEHTIVPLLNKVCSVQLIEQMEKEVIVVDDGSKDNTKALVSGYISSHPQHAVTLIEHPINKGKGAAIRTGISSVSGNYVIIQDADLEYEPEDYNLLLLSLLHENLPVVYGSRFLMKDNKHSYRSFYYGGLLVTTITNLLFNQRLTDEPTCYKAFETTFLRSIKLNCTRFEFCPEVTGKVAKRGIRIKEVPIHYYPRSIHEGKKIRWTDGVEAIWVLIKYRFVN